ncbi:MAG TPA: zf-HC2 domain-containing protein [Steroidobacteraceae bacterium]
MSPIDDRFADHRAAWELIPWVVNGTADEAARALLTTHLAACPDCAAEYQLQSKLRAAISGSEPPLTDATSAYNRLRQRLDDETAGRMPTHRAWSGGGRLLVAMVVLEAVSIVALSSVLWVRGSQDNLAVYRTLGSGEAVPRPATIRAVLDPALNLQGMQELLSGFKLQIVAGPTDAGVYSLAPADPGRLGDTARIVAALRSHAGVRFAEPIEANSSQP